MNLARHVTHVHCFSSHPELDFEALQNVTMCACVHCHCRCAPDPKPMDFLAERGGVPSVTTRGCYTPASANCIKAYYDGEIEKNLFSTNGAPGLKPSLFQIRYENTSLRYYVNVEDSCAGVYKI